MKSNGLEININKIKADILSLKRLNNVSLRRRLLYIINGVFGEVLRKRLFGVFGLRLIEISLTDRCQCMCQHCYAAQECAFGHNEELNQEEVFALLDDIVTTGGTEVIFSGGEPLLREDILTLVYYAHKKGLVVRLITNGILLNEALVGSLKKAGLSWCSISIDSPYASEHDVFRSYEGCFEKAINGLRLLVEYRIPCSIIAVARKEIIRNGDLERIVKLGKQLGVTVVRINFPVPIGKYADSSDQVLSLEERTEVRNLLRYGYVTMESPKEKTKCTAGITKLNVMTNGDVTPCVFVPIPYGNIRQDKLSDIWEAMDRYVTEYMAEGQCIMCDPFLSAKLRNYLRESAKLPNQHPLAH